MALPNVIFGTSGMGNCFKAYTHQEKLAVVSEVVRVMEVPVFDSAGKYGAGLALEELGKCLEVRHTPLSHCTPHNTSQYIALHNTTHIHVLGPQSSHRQSFDQQQARLEASAPDWAGADVRGRRLDRH